MKPIVGSNAPSYNFKVKDESGTKNLEQVLNDLASENEALKARLDKVENLINATVKSKSADAGPKPANTEKEKPA